MLRYILVDFKRHIYIHSRVADVLALLIGYSKTALNYHTLLRPFPFTVCSLFSQQQRRSETLDKNLTENILIVLESVVCIHLNLT